MKKRYIIPVTSFETVEPMRPLLKDSNFTKSDETINGGDVLTRQQIWADEEE